MPIKLFKATFPDDAVSRGYDVTSDGQLFVVFQDEHVRPPNMSEIHVILNWFEKLKQKVFVG